MAFPPGLSPGLGGPPGLQLQVPASALASDGRHRQHLRSSYSLLERLEDMPNVSCPLLLFSSVNIGHRDSSWLGTGIQVGLAQGLAGGTTVNSGLRSRSSCVYCSALAHPRLSAASPIYSEGGRDGWGNNPTPKTKHGFAAASRERHVA
jgi:hypothetical protein